MLKFPGKLQTYIGFTFVMHDQCLFNQKIMPKLPKQLNVKEPFH